MRERERVLDLFAYRVAYIYARGDVCRGFRALIIVTRCLAYYYYYYYYIYIPKTYYIYITALRARGKGAGGVLLLWTRVYI